MQRTDLSIAGPCLLDPRVFGDARGHFYEAWNERTLAELGIPAHFVQENQSRSARGILRGLHYQQPHTQGKLIRVLAGEIFDVVADLRRGSPTLGRWIGTRLSAAAPRMLWVPGGFAHGFLVLSEFADVQYSVTDYYSSEHEHCLRWDDPRLAIAWPLAEASVSTPLVSPKDAAGRSFADTPLFD